MEVKIDKVGAGAQAKRGASALSIYLKKAMAHLRRETSNQFWEELEKWETQIRQNNTPCSSLKI
jgi:hypothetical protein